MPGPQPSGDWRPQKKAGRAALWLHAYQSLGVVYGDLGTSPLYVFPAVFTVQPTQDDVLGSVSLIMWLVTLMVLVKYVCIVLFAEDRGEGGVFAMYSLICRHLQINPTACRDLSAAANPSSQLGTDSAGRPQTCLGMLLKSSGGLQKALLGLAFLGIGAMISDGILVPAIEVISAIQGLQFKVPSLSQGAIVGISCAILVLLFLGQSVGTSKLGHAFAPVLVLFFLSNAAVGIYNIVRYMPGIFKAASPHFAYLFFKHNPRSAWIALGSIALAFSGVEAMSADMGHFSRPAISLAAVGFVYPCLFLIYFGFGAYLATHTEEFANAYYTCIPSKVFWPCFVIATAASIVASQPLISSTYSVLRQSMQLCCFPRVKVVHTSKTVEGQVYIPEANYMLLAVSVAALAGFQNGNLIGNALSVTLTAIMFITTILVAIIMIVVWRLPAFVAATFFCTFGFIEVILLSSALYKVPEGAWFPLMVAALSICVTVAWHMGQTCCISPAGPPPDSFVPLPLKSAGPDHHTSNQGMLESASGEVASSTGLMHRTPGVGIFLLDDLSFTTPAAWTQFFQQTQTIPEVAIFLEVQQASTAFVEAPCMFEIRQHQHHPVGVFQGTHHRGFQDTLCGPALVTDLLQALLAHLQAPEATDATRPEAGNPSMARSSSMQRQATEPKSPMQPGPLMEAGRDLQPESASAQDPRLRALRSRVRLNKIGSAYELPEAASEPSSQPTSSGSNPPLPKTQPQPWHGEGHALNPDPAAAESTAAPAAPSRTEKSKIAPLAPLQREPSTPGRQQVGSESLLQQDESALDDLPVSSPSKYRRTSLVEWLDAAAISQPAGPSNSGSQHAQSSRQAQLCRVVAVALREGMSCWTVRMLPAPDGSRWWLSRLVLRAVYPVLDQACRGYGSQLQLPNALEVVVPVPV